MHGKGRYLKQQLAVNGIWGDFWLEDVLSVEFNGLNGTLSYFVNGVKQGICFISQELVDKEFLPAVALINQGEMLQSQCPINN